MFKKKILISFICLVLLCLDGCGNTLYTSGLSRIKYQNIEYTYDFHTEWVIENSKYINDTVEQDGHILSVRIFDNDQKQEYLYCNDNSLFYHNNKVEYPKNTTNEIECFTYFISPDYPEKNIKIDNHQAIKELERTLSLKPSNSINIKHGFYTLRISYKNYPAVNYFGDIVIDQDNKYWISHLKYIETEDDLETIEEYYPIDANSILLDYI